MCPIGVDQTTRTPQTWHMMVPSLREKYAIHYPGQRRTAWIDTNVREDSWVWEKLARPDPEFLHQPSLSTNTLSSLPTPRPQTSPIMLLPLEIRFEILEYLDKASVLSLSMTCVAFTQQMIPHIEMQIMAKSGPWANQPLACLGTYLTTLPPKFEIDDLAYNSVGMTAPDSAEKRRWLGPQAPARGMCPARRFNMSAISQYAGRSNYLDYTNAPYGKPYPDKLTEHQEWIAALQECKGQAAFQSHPSRMQVLDQCESLILGESFFGPLSIAEGPSKVIWYLRNLDTKQYVRVFRQLSHKKTALLNPDSSPTEAIEPNASRGSSASGAPSKLENKPALSQSTRSRTVCMLDLEEGAGELKAEHFLARCTSWPEARPLRHGAAVVSVEQEQKRSWAGCRFDIVSPRMHMHELRRCSPVPSQTSSDATVSSDDTSVHSEATDDADAWKDVTNVMPYFDPRSVE